MLLSLALQTWKREYKCMAPNVSYDSYVFLEVWYMYTSSHNYDDDLVKPTFGQLMCIAY